MIGVLDKRFRVLRALSRFDSATVEDVSNAIGASEAGRRAVWRLLQAFVAEGLATREGRRFTRYAVTDAGRNEIARAA